MDRLDELREQVRCIDQKIIGLVSRRMAITTQIGEQKREAGIPLRNWGVEKTVIEHAEQVARGTDVSRALVRSIMRLLIQESRIQQERLHYSAFSGDKEKILVVGGLGDMGKWFSYFFQNQGHDVSIYDIRGESEEFCSFKTLIQGLERSTCVCVAASLEATALVLEEIAECGFRGTVFDIASFKDHLTNAVERCRDAGVSVTSIHPMFGPGARTLCDKTICICDCGNAEATARVESLFRDTAAALVRLSFEEHDRIVSYVLGLSHLVNIVFVETLLRAGLDYSQFKDIASTTFLLQMTTAASVIQENPLLYYEIQRLNPFRAELYDELKKSVEAITRTVLAGQQEGFLRIMRAGREWLGYD